MCGAYSLQYQKQNEVYDEFGMHKAPPQAFRPTFNARPGQKHPVITNESALSIMIWGFLPHWVKDKNYKYKTINARAETVAEKPSYKQSLRYKRCIVPCSGFYEPDKIHVSKPPFPWYYFELTDRKLFGLAGLWDEWTDGKETIRTYTILTCQPNELVGQVHDRMPVILHKKDEETWLNPDIVEPEHVLPLLVPYPADKMRSWRVGDEARNPKNDNPDLIKAV
jgi:putative SOS response-associated peptidase YedK